MSGRHKWPPPRRVRDLRDPRALGERLLGDAGAVRGSFGLSAGQAPLSQVYDLHVQHLDIPDYDGGGLMSNDPAKHHSRTPQDAYVESDGGE